MNEERDPEYWYAKAEKDGNLAPQRKLANEKPPGETVDYDELVKTWTAAASEEVGLAGLRFGNRIGLPGPTPLSPGKDRPDEGHVLVVDQGTTRRAR